MNNSTLKGFIRMGIKTAGELGELLNLAKKREEMSKKLTTNKKGA